MLPLSTSRWPRNEPGKARLVLKLAAQHERLGKPRTAKKEVIQSLTATWRQKNQLFDTRIYMSGRQN